MDNVHGRDEREGENSLSKHVSRREFLKIAGVAGAVVGTGAGLGGLLSACGGETTTTTAAPATTEETTATTAGSTTTVSAAAELGREVKVGFVYPKTGGLAFFAPGDEWAMGRWAEAVGDGIVLGDGKKHLITVVAADGQSDTNRTAQVAGDLISNSGVDLLMAVGAPTTCNPVSDQGEANGVPVLNSSCPWEGWFYGRGGTADKPFKWTFLQNCGLGDFAVNFIGMWDTLSSNKKFGAMWGNDTDGLAWADTKTGMPYYMAQKGYTVVDPGRYQPGTEDYTKEISAFKKEGVEGIVAAMLPPDFTNFWSQAHQQGLNAQLKICTVGLALLFGSTCQAIGDTAYNCSVELGWHKDYPYKSTLTGETCQELADSYEKVTGTQWAFPIAHYSIFEWAVDVLKRTKNPDDKESILEAILGTKTTTIYGPLDFTAPVSMDSWHPLTNVCKSTVAAGQWQKGTKYPFEEQIVYSNSPEVKTTAEFLPL
jgi:branched-chain amino acid transport system substrate-binding protein